jgi:hypothetical protein
MNRPLPVVLASLLCTLSLAACAATPRPSQLQSTGGDPTGTRAAVCDATSLSWTIGKVADDALVERARSDAGAQTVRMLRPGVMITNEFNATRLNIRVDNDRKVITTSCG